MEIQGFVISTGSAKTTATKNGNTFVSKELVIEYDINGYKKKVAFVIFGENRCNEINPSAGEEVKVSFDIDAREWNGRWFNTLSCWKVESVSVDDKPAPQPKKENVQKPKEEPMPTSVADDDEDDNLPF